MGNASRLERHGKKNAATYKATGWATDADISQKQTTRPRLYGENGMKTEKKKEKVRQHIR